jgi:hypothetical protein
VWGLGLRVSSFGFKIECVQLGVSGSGFREFEGLGSRVQGLGGWVDLNESCVDILFPRI